MRRSLRKAHVAPTRRSERGLSMIELTISASIFAILSVGAVVFFRGTMKSMDESAQGSRVLNVATSGITFLQRDFGMSTPSHIWVEASNPCCDEVRLQVPVDLDAAGPIWGAVSAQPIEVNEEPRQRHPGWKVRYHVEGSTLVRDIVDEEDEPVAGTAIVIARDLLPYEAVARLFGTGGGQTRGGTTSTQPRVPKIFRIWQPDPGDAPRIYAGVITTAVPISDGDGQMKLGPWNEHRTTLRAERN
ncbi:MAG: prepilin-type N-terminal cleavage/methylation domain-containing protein [Planctomycetes bacterium]|nr:prepilin-type N-terminal cleavage/methylation domain-containing protein [Planctomycetota bacterium]